jgi:hypothetical protein
MERQAEEYIKGLSDIDLLEYTRTDTHLPESLEFAGIELADRHLSPERLAALEKQLQQRREVRQQRARELAAEPLPSEWRIAVFLCGLCLGFALLVFIPSWLRFRREGARQKNKDMYIFALVGFCLQPLLICLRIPPWAWLIDLF